MGLVALILFCHLSQVRYMHFTLSLGEGRGGRCSHKHTLTYRYTRTLPQVHITSRIEGFYSQTWDGRKIENERTRKINNRTWKKWDLKDRLVGWREELTDRIRGLIKTDMIEIQTCRRRGEGIVCGVWRVTEGHTKRKMQYVIHLCAGIFCFICMMCGEYKHGKIKY